MKKEKLRELKRGDLCLCVCPDWNEEGYQVAVWKGDKFEYSSMPNDMFNEHVVDFELIEDII